jgi:aryl-alcohol dehydrogenase-like predicted oxidoreductase
MEKRRIGSLEVSVVGLGCNNFGRRLDADATAAVVNAALDAGINFFDTADIYGNGQSEEYIGRALGNRRHEVIIATKFGNEMEGQGKGASPAYIRKAAEASLRRLGIEQIDLYQLHTPDPETPIEDTLGALNDLVKEGKVREIGSSNFSAEQIRAAETAAQGKARFVSVQNEYHLLKYNMEQDVLAECDRLGIAYLPFFPLASGLLTGKYRQGQPLPEGTRITNNPANVTRWLTEQNLALVEDLIKFSESCGHTILELAFAWLLAKPSVASVIAGAMTPEQIHANANAASWQLTSADLAEIDAILARHEGA